MKQINKILFITLSNIGDAILTMPALDTLMHDYPKAVFYVMCSQRPKELFENNPRIGKIIVFDKHAGVKSNIRLFNALRKEKFDVVVDLRNTFFGVALPARYRLHSYFAAPKAKAHMSQRHLLKVGGKIKSSVEPIALRISPSEEEHVVNILKENNISEGDQLIVISAGARSSVKRWPQEKFAQLVQKLEKGSGFKIALVGDKADSETGKYIKESAGAPVADLTGKTSLKELAALLKRARLVIGNDSATLHLASYLNRPVLAIFGPTDEKKYGPWSDNSRTARRYIFCRPCEEAACGMGEMKCLNLIRVEDVYKAAKELLEGREISTNVSDFKRILVVRTDRIGDALLSTPALKALREAYPNSYIAMMAASCAKDIFEGNPYLDEVIVFDKDRKHKGIINTLRFAAFLKNKKFNLALHLHPTNRVHLLSFLAGIPKRVGYDRKLAYFLTDRIKHTKQLGEKHESEYALDLVRYLGVEPGERELYMPISVESEAWAKEALVCHGIKEGDKLLAVHPAASDISRIWPVENFAKAANQLADKYGFRILIISGPNAEHIKICRDMASKLEHPVVDLSGKTSISQLASILKRCQLYISSDTGPMHIASVLGVPTICLFGRKQAGISPKRWGPLGKRSRVIHKDVGCVACLAHNCVKGFACFKAIKVEDVVAAADSLLKEG